MENLKKLTPADAITVGNGTAESAAGSGGPTDGATGLWLQAMMNPKIKFDCREMGLIVLCEWH